MPRGLFTAPSVRFFCLALAVLTLLLYAPSLWHGYFDSDDDEYVFANAHVLTGLTPANIVWAFQSGGYACNWHPVTWLSHMLDRQLFGPSIALQHLVNILLHAGNAVLLFLVWHRMTLRPWRSAVVAALFAWHPAHVESVAWIAERKDVLSTFFFLLTLLAYQRYAAQPGARRYLLALLFFALGLMAKPMLVTLPFVLLLLDYWPLERWQKPARFGWLLVEKIPFLLLAATASLITLLVQKQGGAVVPLAYAPISMRLGNAVLSYTRYTGELFWPVHLIFPYRHGSLDAPAVTLAGLALIFTVIIVLERGGRRPYLPVGLFWFLGTLVPVLGIVQVGSQAMADRYTYIPSIGLFVMVAWAGVEFLPRRIGALAAAVALALLAVLTARQLSYWQNGATLYSHTLLLEPDNMDALNGLAWTYATDPDPKLRDGVKALALATHCVEITHRRVAAFVDTLAAAQAENGDFGTARATTLEGLALPEIKYQPLLESMMREHLHSYDRHRAIYAP